MKPSEQIQADLTAIEDRRNGRPITIEDRVFAHERWLNDFQRAVTERFNAIEQRLAASNLSPSQPPDAEPLTHDCGTCHQRCWRAAWIKYYPHLSEPQPCGLCATRNRIESAQQADAVLFPQRSAPAPDWSALLKCGEEIRLENGVPVVRGSSFPIASVLRELGRGRSLERLIADYGLDDDNLRASIEQASRYFARKAPAQPEAPETPPDVEAERLVDSFEAAAKNQARYSGALVAEKRDSSRTTLLTYIAGLRRARDGDAELSRDLTAQAMIAEAHGHTATAVLFRRAADALEGKS